MKKMDLYDFLSRTTLIGSLRGLEKEEKKVLEILGEGRKHHNDLEASYKETGFPPETLMQSFHRLNLKGYIKMEGDVGLPYYSLTFSGKVAARKLH